MDLLDSILGKMDTPPDIKKPVIKDEEKRAKFEKMLKDREEFDRKQRQLLDEFRGKFEKRLHEFINTPINEDDEKTTKLNSKPLAKIYRTIVHEVCEDHEEVIAYSFGTEEIDRHCVIWKRGYEPKEEEIMAMKAGVEYKPRKDQESDDDDDNDDPGNRRKRKSARQPTDKEVAEGCLRVESAQMVVPGKQYGFVPVALKTDSKSVEQVIDERRELKRQKLAQASREHDEAADDKKDDYNG